MGHRNPTPLASDNRGVPPLDPTFVPFATIHRDLRNGIAKTAGQPFAVALEGRNGAIARIDAALYPEAHPRARENAELAARLIKSLLWERGGGRLIVAGPDSVTSHVASCYGQDGTRRFDATLMARIYGDWSIEITALDEVPESVERPTPIGGHLDGCRIGFDLGASDWKIAAVVDGDAVFTNETPWNPSEERDPETHYRILSDGLREAAGHLPRVDAIGGSAAGVYIDNRVRVASLFRGVPTERFDDVETLFLRLQREWGVPFVLANDGDVTALAGSLSLGVKRLLGIALGSSEACGYVDAAGQLTGWLNELAFVPIDLQPDAPADDWSGDTGCGAQYLSQQGVLRLARRSGIPLCSSASRAEQLVEVQALMRKGNERAEQVFRSLGCYLGHAIAQYAEDYDIEHVLVLGRVTSGAGGLLLVETAQSTLKAVYPKVAEAVSLRLPDEAFRRVGQAIAAASLPEINPRGKPA